MEKLFEISEKVRLIADPLDEQLGGFISKGIKIIIDVKDVSHLKGTSGQWVKIAEHQDWIDSSYFERVFENENCPHCNSDRIKRCPPDMSDWCLNCSAVIRKNND